MWPFNGKTTIDTDFERLNKYNINDEDRKQMTGAIIEMVSIIIRRRF